ncbi:hypothetical protein [Kurthia sibirica]|uniref:Uncharacterized protein n=1 Tax=Kurthia sibirica TaxID=202750 RepID=A0A2U3ALL6_9BACL|nr:hypothetical protein [Kurthia sibirica]PWI25392.1 hypothetical protein DEX24_08625 [Kurthia sibirica]GEK34590.1 hypothetical protein KSI01_21230 [Kurthia sibirica]
MGQFKNEMTRDFKNMKDDINHLVNCHWTTTYDNYKIHVSNKMKCEQLFIDDQLLVEKKHTSFLYMFKPSETLKGVLPNGEKIVVKLHGIKSVICTIKINGEIIYSNKIAPQINGWTTREPLIPYIVQVIESEGVMTGYDLPDDDYYQIGTEKLPAIPYQLQIIEESVFQKHESKSLYKKLMKLLEEQSNKNRNAVYELVIAEEYFTYMDAFDERLNEGQFNHADMKEVALWFIHHSAHRYALIFGIQLLSKVPNDTEVELLQKIAMNENFTPFAMNILRTKSRQNDIIFAIAQRLEHWGKVYAVEALQIETDEQKNWLTGQSYNDLAPDVFLNKAAFLQVLTQETISIDQYTTIGRLIIDKIEEGELLLIDQVGEFLILYTKHAKHHAFTLQLLKPLVAIYPFITQETDSIVYDDDGEIEVYEEDDYSLLPVEKTMIKSNIQDVLNNMQWQQHIVEAFDTKTELYEAIMLAKIMNINTVKYMLAAMYDGVYEDEIYMTLIMDKNVAVIQEVLEFIDTSFDLNNLTKEQEQCLFTVIVSFEERQEIGSKLVRKVLYSSNDMGQYAALTVLDEWPATSWKTPEIVERLHEISKKPIDEDRETQDCAKRLLKKLNKMPNKESLK